MDAGQLVARSSNYTLYGDLSQRVMTTLASFGHPQEVYSIDECFLDLCADGDPQRIAIQIRAKVIHDEDWEEGSSIVTSPGAHIAVLWTVDGADVRCAVLTQPPPAAHQYIERFPVPLTQAWAIGWLDVGPTGDQVTELHVAGAGGQQTIFDE